MLDVGRRGAFLVRRKVLTRQGQWSMIYIQRDHLGVLSGGTKSSYPQLSVNKVPPLQTRNAPTVLHALSKVPLINFWPPHFLNLLLCQRRELALHSLVYVRGYNWSLVNGLYSKNILPVSIFSILWHFQWRPSRWDGGVVHPNIFGWGKEYLSPPNIPTMDLIFYW